MKYFPHTIKSEQKGHANPLFQVLSDLVQGEFMQLGSKENENERFAHYLKKSFKKTASLLAYSCKAVSITEVLSAGLCGYGKKSL